MAHYDLFNGDDDASYLKCARSQHGSAFEGRLVAPEYVYKAKASGQV